MSGGLLVGLLVLPCLALPGLLPAAWAGGAGDGALRMTVTVNGRGHSGLRPPTVRVGAQVVKRYRLVNSGEAHLYGVRVVDPAVPAGAVRCAGRTLAALGELECVARFRAVGGMRRATARVEGDIPSLQRRLAATARTGYVGVAGGLRLTERVTVSAPGRSGRSLGPAWGSATVAYTVTNHGNRPLHAVRIGDPGLGLAPGATDCGAGGGAVAVLAPGASARCTAVVRRPPGTHRSTGVASGSDRITTYGPRGERLPAPVLTARSSAVFTLPSRASTPPSAVPVEPKPKPKPRTAAGSGGAPGRPAGSGGVGVAGAVAVPRGAAGAVGLAGAAGAPAGATGAAGAAGAPAAPAGAAGAAGVAPGVAAEGLPVLPPAPTPAPPTPAASLAVPPGSLAPSALVAEQRSDSTAPPSARRAAVLDNEGFLGRLRRRGREASELGIVVILLLLLIPAAIAAALLGNRRG
ncbi:hypothetical protein H4W23_19905 [Streptomyces gardneri]|uniref:hypothetical protein n=1 Tax=Streptomyces gardneri TaxID=66892 RepID=UPI00099E4029|nr:hypothetical protein [Streptomyces gardneri]QPK46672.1 hypothetical protein H4W23_19905 [Streptomyces gardneri]WRK38067.1 hypothetical protein U0M97_20005 [Streptomyces venezuelae]